MDEKETIDKNQEELIARNGFVHFILAHGYVLFFFAIVLGVILDVFIKIEIFQSLTYSKTGIVMIFLGTCLIYWAQRASKTASKTKPEVPTEEAFEYGPYKYFRNPTYLGLLIMTIGLGLVIHSFFAVALAVIAHVFIKYVFVKKEERMLEVKYGHIYNNYKKKVKSWI